MTASYGNDRGQPGQWREEWALVVRWSAALREIDRGTRETAGMSGYGGGRQMGFMFSLRELGEAMGWPDWLRRRWL
jgi:hypothetical protein